MNSDIHQDWQIFKHFTSKYFLMLVYVGGLFFWLLKNVYFNFMYY